MKRVLETDGEAHRTIQMYSIPLHATLTNSEFYVMCLSPQFKNIYEKKDTRVGGGGCTLFSKR